MNVFLRSAKERLRSTGTMKIVLGNEGCDLDSMVCALVWAKYCGGIPVFNSKRMDLPLRSDAVWLFNRLGLSMDHIPCIEDVNLVKLHSQGLLQLVLVDHNRLADSQRGLESSVIQVIDHHVDSGDFTTNKVLEMTGSASTLVADMVGDLIKDSDIATLCYSAIILDTAAFDASTRKFLPRDMEVAARLLPFCHSDIVTNPTSYYQQLLAARLDVSNLTSSQLMRRDSKCSSSLYVASVPLDFQEWFNKDGNVVTAFQNIATGPVSTVAVMTMFTDSSGNFSRGLGLYFSSSLVRERFLSKLATYNPFKLSCIDIHPTILCFNQADVVSSRKQVMPWLVESLNT